jgi:hypothetical protein
MLIMYDSIHASKLQALSCELVSDLCVWHMCAAACLAWCFGLPCMVLLLYVLQHSAQAEQ